MMDLISLAEYAEAHGITPDAVRQKVLRGVIPAVKIGRNWCIDPATPYPDLRVKSGKYKKKKKDE